MSNITLLPHQINVVNHMKKHRGAIVIHETGSGKTITSLAVIKDQQLVNPDLKTLIVSPLSIIKQFRAQVEQWNLKNVEFSTYHKLTEIMFDDKGKLKNLDLSNTLLIVDEAHNMRTTVKFTSDKDLSTGQRSYALLKCAAMCKKVLCLTATPIINEPFDIYNLAMMVKGVHPEDGITSNSFDNAVDDKLDFFNFFKCMCSVYSDVDNEGKKASKIEHFVPFVMDEAYYNKYRKIEQSQVTPEIMKELKTASTSNSFYTLLRRAVNALDGVESPKVEWIKDFLETTIPCGEKTIIFSNWKDAGINLVSQMLEENDIDYEIITGDCEEDDRYHAMEKYNAGNVNVLLISKAGCEGLDLKATNHVIIMESNWNEAMDQQIIGRAIRLGSHDHLDIKDRLVNVHRLIMTKPKNMLDNDNIKKSVDEALYDIAYKHKKNVNDKFLDRLREVSIESIGCCCHMEKSLLTFKPCSFVKRSSKQQREFVSPYIWKVSGYETLSSYVNNKKDKKSVNNDLPMINHAIKVAWNNKSTFTRTY